MKKEFNVVAIVARRLTDRILESITKIDSLLNEMGIQTLLEEKVLSALKLDRGDGVVTKA